LTEMDVLTVSVKTAQTFEATTIREKGYLYHNISTFNFECRIFMPATDANFLTIFQKLKIVLPIIFKADLGLIR
jgi:hypothetical protein